jgi:hypothetical protein
MRGPRARHLVRCLSALALLGLAGCAAYRQLVGEHTLTLERAELVRMEVDLHRPVKKICPREPVQMWVRVDARLPGQPAATRLETWTGGPDTRRNGMLDFGNFEFTSGQGTFDEFGWFHPRPDILATVDRGFEIRTAFRHRPDVFTETRVYEPDYSCVRTAGGTGAVGPSGRDGASGTYGAGGDDHGRGAPGGPGGSGGPGGPGQPGPRVQAYATYVRTRFYPRLIAVRLDGEVRDLVLAPADQPLLLTARGGPGGAGGSGGRGGNGGDGGRGRPGRPGGAGGAGGNGGAGGDGGPGGTLELVYDGRFPELGQLIGLDVAGGDPGTAGPGGSGGTGGDGGRGRDGARNGPGGPGGPAGSDGHEGRPGPAGTTRLRPGAVTERFRGLPGIQPF